MEPKRWVADLNKIKTGREQNSIFYSQKQIVLPVSSSAGPKIQTKFKQCQHSYLTWCLGRRQKRAFFTLCKTRRAVGKTVSPAATSQPGPKQQITDWPHSGPRLQIWTLPCTPTLYFTLLRKKEKPQLYADYPQKGGQTARTKLLLSVNCLCLKQPPKWDQKKKKNNYKGFFY